VGAKIDGCEKPNADPKVSPDSGSAFDGVGSYPAPIGDQAYFGITGAFVRLVSMHTEADPNFLLISFLVAAGSVLGRVLTYGLEPIGTTQTSSHVVWDVHQGA